MQSMASIEKQVETRINLLNTNTWLGAVVEPSAKAYIKSNSIINKGKYNKNKIY